jgi:hypothetical protein
MAGAVERELGSFQSGRERSRFMFTSTQQCCSEQELEDAHGRLAVQQGKLRGAEGSFMTLRERRVQQNVVRSQELWQLGEDGAVRESTSCE